LVSAPAAGTAAAVRQSTASKARMGGMLR
jgi:hypothetical protein